MLYLGREIKVFGGERREVFLKAAQALGYQVECLGTGVLRGEPDILHYAVQPLPNGIWKHRVSGETRTNGWYCVEASSAGFTEQYTCFGGNREGLKFRGLNVPEEVQALFRAHPRFSKVEFTIDFWYDPRKKEISGKNITLPLPEAEWEHIPLAAQVQCERVEVSPEGNLLVTDDIGIFIKNGVPEVFSKKTSEVKTSLEWVDPFKASQKTISFAKGTTDGGVVGQVMGFD